MTRTLKDQAADARALRKIRERQAVLANKKADAKRRIAIVREFLRYVHEAELSPLKSAAQAVAAFEELHPKVTLGNVADAVYQDSHGDDIPDHGPKEF